MAVYKKSAEMRSHILCTTEQLVLQNGYKKATIKDIADHLGVPRSLIYYYFKDKQDIMTVLYQERFQNVDVIVSSILPHGKEPMVRLILKYLVFRQTVSSNPLFTEFIMESEFAILDPNAVASQIERYYADSRDAFAACGKSISSKQFNVHVHILEGVARALIMAEYYQTLTLTDWEAMDYLGKYSIMPTFELTEAEYHQILSRVFKLAEQIQHLTAVSKAPSIV